MLAFNTNSIFPKQANIWTLFWATVQTMKLAKASSAMPHSTKQLMS